MKIEIEIPPERVMQLFASAIEGGDPVTTASKGGWCNGIDLKAASFPLGGTVDLGALWWDTPEYFADGVALTIEVLEIDDETTGHVSEHTVTTPDIVRGLTVMAKQFPHLFAGVLDGDIDAACADVFLQSMLFGEERYA